MFLRIFILSIIATLFSTIISVAYMSVFIYSPLEVDFTEKASISFFLTFNVMICLGAGILYFGLSKIIKNENLVSFITGFILSSLVIMIAVLWMFKVDKSLTFKNENAETFKDYFYYILAPIAFFPVLSWQTFKPLFIKKTNK